MKVGIAFLTKDRVELTKQSIAPLLQPDKFDLHWFDGSVTDEGQALLSDEHCAGACHIWQNVRGGPDAAIVYSLSTLLRSLKRYDVIGLVENDVLLAPDWFEKTIELFETGNWVGAVSARCYKDRVLFLGDGYAVMHNLGAGMILLRRQAAEIILDNYRTGFTSENRETFMQLTGIDIGNYWAFKQSLQWITADWQFDRILVQNGYGSLALVPSACEMIGQETPLAQQGLELVTTEFADVDGKKIDQYANNLDAVRRGAYEIPGWGNAPRFPDGAQVFFPHQLRLLKHSLAGQWNLKWLQGFGPFAYIGKKGSVLHVDVSGPIAFSLVNAHRFVIRDERSGFVAQPSEREDDNIVMVHVPAGVLHRTVSLEVVEDGGLFCALWTVQPQGLMRDRGLQWGDLPPVE